KQKEKGFEAALQIVRTDKGKKVMDDARKVVGDMKDEEMELLQRRNPEAEASAQATMYTIGIGTLLAVLLMTLGGYFIIRSITNPVRDAINRLTSTRAEILPGT